MIQGLVWIVNHFVGAELGSTRLRSILRGLMCFGFDRYGAVCFVAGILCVKYGFGWRRRGWRRGRQNEECCALCK